MFGIVDIVFRFFNDKEFFLFFNLIIVLVFFFLMFGIDFNFVKLVLFMFIGFELFVILID